MLQLTLLPALVAPSFAPVLAPRLPEAPTRILCAEELSHVLPADSVGVLLIGELDTHLLGEGAGQWANFLRDERWIGALVTMAESEGEDAELMQKGAVGAHLAVQGLRGGAFSFDESGDTLLGVLRVDDGWLERFGAHMGEVRGPLVETTCLGRPALSETHPSGTGTVLFVDGGAHVFIAAQADLQSATTTIGALIEALEASADDTTQRWWLASDARVSGALFEVFFDLGAAMPAGDLEEFTATVGAPGIAYGAVVLGEGQTAEAVMTFEIEGGPVMDAVASSLVPADTALFSYVPEGYTGTVIGLDVLAAIEEGLVFAEETTPGASTDYDQSLDALAGLLGVDLEEDLLGHLTGQILMLQPNADFGSLAELGEGPAAMESLFPVIALQIDDVDAVLGVLEAISDAAATQGLEAETAELGGGSMWSFDPGMGFNLAIAAGSGFLTIGTEQGAVDFFERVATPDAERTVANEALAALAKELDGSLVTMATMATVVDSFASVGEAVESLGLEDGEDAAVIEVLNTVGVIAREHLSGVMGAELQFTTKRVTYRMLSR